MVNPLDVVSRGILMLPAQPLFVPLPALSAQLTHFEVEALSVPDVVITKLKPFRPTRYCGHRGHDPARARDPRSIRDLVPQRR